MRISDGSSDVCSSDLKAPPTASAPPKPTAAKPAATARHFVQVATFSAKANAEATAKTLGGTVSAAGRFWRVRTGPFAREAEAQAALAKAKIGRASCRERGGQYV